MLGFLWSVSLVVLIVLARTKKKGFIPAQPSKHRQWTKRVAGAVFIATTIWGIGSLGSSGSDATVSQRTPEQKADDAAPEKVAAQQATALGHRVEAPLAPAPAHSTDTKLLTQQACKAGVALLMGRDPATMKVEKFSKGIVYFHYIRADDGTKWGYKCKLDQHQVVWAANNPDGSGRWRTQYEDGYLVYRIDGDRMWVRQNYTDGSSSEDSFPLSSL